METKMKCVDCIYREYDSWNNPNGYFCERKTKDEIDEDDYMSSRVLDSQECDVKIYYSASDIEYGFEVKEVK